jgi:NAD-dependent SIR2 family protein deacetylase
MASTAHTDPEMLRERHDPPEELASKVDTLVEMIRAAAHFVAFTGAGISTSCGIPDFRGPEGKWTREAQGKQPKRGVSTVRALPSATHMSLVKLQSEGILHYLISQNCDGLHRRSGMPAEAISELHGNSNIEICEDCGQSFFRDMGCHRFASSRDHLTGRFCTRTGCGGPLLEYTIDFGQNLPAEPLRRADEHSRLADLHLVLGSSLTVSPACDMPRQTAEHGDLVIVNLQPTPLDDVAALKIHAPTDVVMQMVMARLALDIPPFLLRRRFVASLDRSPEVSGKRARASLTTVDVHDPTLELSLLRRVDWPAASSGRKADLHAVPVALHFVGHYNEPELSLDLDLATTGLLDVELTYDPIQRVWSVEAERALDAPHEPSDLVLQQQEHGRDYARSHAKYVLAGLVKANPQASKEQCRKWDAERRARLLGAVRDGLTGRRGTVEEEPFCTSSGQIRVAAMAMSDDDDDDGDDDRGGSPGSLPAPSHDPRKIEIDGRPGEFFKVATERDLAVMRDHTTTCDHPKCRSLWQGPWGAFIGGKKGQKYFDLTECREGAKLNRLIGWDEADPRS